MSKWLTSGQTIYLGTETVAMAVNEGIANQIVDRMNEADMFPCMFDRIDRLIAAVRAESSARIEQLERTLSSREISLEYFRNEALRNRAAAPATVVCGKCLDTGTSPDGDARCTECQK